MAPKIELRQQVRCIQQMKPHQWNGQEQQFEERAPQHNKMAQMVHTEQEKCTSDVIEDFNKRKVQERANEHLAKVSGYSIQGILFAISVLPSCVTHIRFISSL